MIYLPIALIFFIALVVLVPLLVLVVGLDIFTIVFQKLNLSPIAGFAIYFASLLGSAINIPVKEKESFLPEIDSSVFYGLFLPKYHRPTKKTVIAINVGGAIIPVLLSIYLLLRTPIVPVVICVALITVIARLLSRPIKGFGIALPAFIPPLFAALFASLFSHTCTPCVAYISGVMGTLIGADILNLRRLDKIGAGMLSIGGAGVFDGIFLTGIIAVLLA